MYILHENLCDLWLWDVRLCGSLSRVSKYLFVQYPFIYIGIIKRLTIDITN
jgi:hypothetical protein